MLVSMRKGFAVLLTVSILFGGGYFYYIAQAVCKIPITYTLGTIDERFDLTAEEARLALADAESAWEDATGKNLFSYEEDGDLVINFTYDQRQEFVEAENELKDKLDATENISEAIGETYATLVEQYSNLEITYKDRVEAYERKLNRYNQEVEEYNSQGGAPAEVYAQLELQKEELSDELRQLRVLEDKLNKLVEEINSVGEKGNSIINTYNKGVNVYNKTFGESHEFTQGDYRHNEISIYTFEDPTELKLVLIHEFGHALSLDHVENERSVMHYLIGAQPSTLELTEEDLDEFDRVCGEKNLWEKLTWALSRR